MRRIWPSPSRRCFHRRLLQSSISFIRLHSTDKMPTHDSPGVRKFNPEDHPLKLQNFYHVSEVPISATAKLVSIAGQVGTDPKRPDLPLVEQIRNALHRLDICLMGAGVTKSDIISVRQYLVKFTSMSAEEQQARTDRLSAVCGVNICIRENLPLMSLYTESGYVTTSRNNRPTGW